MWLGLLIGLSLLVVGIVLISKDNIFDGMTWLGVVLVFSGVSFLAVGFIYAEDRPQNSDNLYSISGINDSPTIYFEDYSQERDNILISNHYYVEYSWVNRWKYCSSPITVIVPKMTNVRIQGGPDGAYIVGGCNEEKH